MTDVAAPPRKSAASIPELAAEVAALAEQRGQADAAGQLRALLALDSPETTVVVVGETNRGKSSLVNALLGVEASPVDFEVATSAYVVMKHGSRKDARVQLRDGQSRSVPLEEVSEWATADGSRSGDVQAVEVFVESPLLERGLTLIDTPGVGGLTASHAKVTQAALVHADAVLFVVDPDAPLSEPELQFLERVTERVGTVLFVLTKIDIYRGWQVIRDADREVLARRVERFADAAFIPVSSTLKADAALAATEGDAQYAAELRADSGFDTLESALATSVIGHAHELRLVNLAAVSRGAISRLRLLERITETPDDPALERELVRATESLQELSKARAEWSVNLASDFEELRERLEDEYDRRVLELKQGYDSQIAAWEDGFAEGFPGALQEDVDGLAADLEMIYREGVADILDHLAEALEFHGDDAAASGQQGVSLPDATATAAVGGQGASKARTIQSLVMSTAAGARLGALAPGIGLTMGIGLGVLGGAIAGIALAKVMRKIIDRGAEQARQRQQAAKALQTALDIARVEIRNPLQRRASALRRQLIKDIRRHVEERTNELQDEIQRHQQAKRQTKAERDRAARDATVRLQALDGLEKRLADGMRAVEAGRGPDAAVAELVGAGRGSGGGA